MKLDEDRVRGTRERRGLTLAMVAQRAGTSKNTVLSAEHGADIRPTTARKIAEALNVEIDDLLAPPSQQLTLMQMPPDEFDERRRAAIAGEIDDVEFREALLRGYNAAGRTLKRLLLPGASAEDLEQAKEEYDEAKKRWLVAVVDDAETTIALDTKRDAASVERLDTRDLPLDEAFEQIQGRLGVPV